MKHYCCMECVRQAGYPEWYRLNAQHEPQLCCVCDTMTTEWLPCTASKTDDELMCATVHLEDVT